MEILAAAALAGIGLAAGGILYQHYFRKTGAREQVEVAAESPVSISFSSDGQSVAEKIRQPKEAENRKVGGAPLKAICRICKEAAMLPFRCKFCTSLYCGDHRLPENHDCTAL